MKKAVDKVASHKNDLREPDEIQAMGLRPWVSTRKRQNQAVAKVASRKSDQKRVSHRPGTGSYAHVNHTSKDRQVVIEARRPSQDFICQRAANRKMRAASALSSTRNQPESHSHVV